MQLRWVVVYAARISLQFLQERTYPHGATALEIAEWAWANMRCAKATVRRAVSTLAARGIFRRVGKRWCTVSGYAATVYLFVRRSR